MKSLDSLPLSKDEFKKEKIEGEESVSDNYGYAQVGESSRPSQGDIIQRKHERSRSM